MKKQGRNTEGGQRADSQLRQEERPRERMEEVQRCDESKLEGEEVV